MQFKTLYLLLLLVLLLFAFAILVPAYIIAKTTGNNCNIILNFNLLIITLPKSQMAIT